MPGLVWVSQSSVQSQVYVHTRVRQRKTHIVLRYMYERVDSSLPDTDGLSPELSLSPYAENGPVAAPVPFSQQAVMVWVVRRDPRLAVTYRVRFHVNLPPRVFRDPSPLQYVLSLCRTISACCSVLDGLAGLSCFAAVILLQRPCGRW